MDKKNKGLVDENEHGIILNESGTSVSFGWDAGDSTGSDEKTSQQAEDDATIQPPGNTDERLIPESE